MSKLNKKSYTTESIALIIVLIGTIVLSLLYIFNPFFKLNINIHMMIVIIMLIAFFVWIFNDDDNNNDINNDLNFI